MILLQVLQCMMVTCINIVCNISYIYYMLVVSHYQLYQSSVDHSVPQFEKIH